MTTYIAFLRGVNVGGNNKVEMGKLKKTLEQLGLVNVTTLIASGNVLFVSKELNQEKLALKIEAAIKVDFDIQTKVLLLSYEKLHDLVKAIPISWVNDKAMKCDVMLLWKEIDTKDIVKQLPINDEIEDILYIPGAVIWRIDREKVTKSRMTKIVGTKLYKQMTVRNPNTIRKIYAHMRELDALRKEDDNQ